MAAIVGLDNRATMDMDTTLKNLPLTPESIRQALTDIGSVPLNDGTSFEIGEILPIRETDIYGGYRVSLTGRFDTILTPLTIDISTGDVLTPGAVPQTFKEMFNEEKTFVLWAYSIETILAEKLETILSRGTFNTRPRDFYDVYILNSTQKYDREILMKALAATAEHRSTVLRIADTKSIIANLKDSAALRERWENYKKQFTYAKDISFDSLIHAILVMLSGNDCDG